MKTDLEKRIEDTLNSLDGIQRAEPQPFFYTRVMGRLQRGENTSWENLGSFLARPVVVVAGLVLVFVMNAFMLYRQDNATTVAAPVAHEQPVTDNDYILASNSSFDYENIDPQ